MVAVAALLASTVACGNQRQAPQRRRPAETVPIGRFDPPDDYLGTIEMRLCSDESLYALTYGMGSGLAGLAVGRVGEIQAPRMLTEAQDISSLGWIGCERILIDRSVDPVASSDPDGLVVVDASTGEVREVPAAAGLITEGENDVVAVSPDGKSFAVIAHQADEPERHVFVGEFGDAQAAQMPDLESRDPMSVAFAANGDVLVAGAQAEGAAGDVLFRAAPGAPLEEFGPAVEGVMLQIATSPECDVIVVVERQMMEDEMVFAAVRVDAGSLRSTPIPNSATYVGLVSGCREFGFADETTLLHTRLEG